MTPEPRSPSGPHQRHCPRSPPQEAVQPPAPRPRGRRTTGRVHGSRSPDWRSQQQRRQPRRRGPSFFQSSAGGPQECIAPPTPAVVQRSSGCWRRCRSHPASIEEALQRQQAWHDAGGAATEAPAQYEACSRPSSFTPAHRHSGKSNGALRSESAPACASQPEVRLRRCPRKPTDLRPHIDYASPSSSTPLRKLAVSLPRDNVSRCATCPPSPDPASRGWHPETWRPLLPQPPAPK